MSPVAEGWHLDKKVPIALIFAIAAQTAMGIWWASSLNGRVDRLEITVAQSTPASQDRQDRIVRLETQVQGVRESLDDIKKALANIDRKLDQR